MNQLSTVKKGISFLAILAVFVLAPIWASACSNLGPEKHMGVVLGVDSVKGTMALRDAETQQVLNFVMDETLLRKIKVDDRIVIIFQKKKDQLIAKDLVVHVSKKETSIGG